MLRFSPDNNKGVERDIIFRLIYPCAEIRARRSEVRNHAKDTGPFPARKRTVGDEADLHAFDTPGNIGAVASIDGFHKSTRALPINRRELYVTNYTYVNRKAIKQGEMYTRQKLP